LLPLGAPIAAATVGVLAGTLLGERILLGLPPTRFRMIVSAVIGVVGVGVLVVAWS
jgi:uncharacterized membrane protein YfcA